MSNGSKDEKKQVISEEVYERLCIMGIRYMGFVQTSQGLIYILPEVVVVAQQINNSGTEFMFDIHKFDVPYQYSTDSNTNNYYSGVNVNDDSSSNFLRSIAPGLGVGLLYVGDNNVLTRGKFVGATPNTSIASTLFRNHSPLRNIPAPEYFRKFPSHKPLFPRTKPIPYMGSGAKNMGQVAGRATPFVGRNFLILGAGVSVYNIHSSGYDRKVITQEAGGWTGAWAGAKLGASGGATAGAAIGVWFFGAGAGPGAAIGGFVGGVGGSILGYWGGYNAAGEIYEVVTE